MADETEGEITIRVIPGKMRVTDFWLLVRSLTLGQFVAVVGSVWALFTVTAGTSYFLGSSTGAPSVSKLDSRLQSVQEQLVSESRLLHSKLDEESRNLRTLRMEVRTASLRRASLSRIWQGQYESKQRLLFLRTEWCDPCNRCMTKLMESEELYQVLLSGVVLAEFVVTSDLQSCIDGQAKRHDPRCSEVRRLERMGVVFSSFPRIYKLTRNGRGERRARWIRDSSGRPPGIPQLLKELGARE